MKKTLDYKDLLPLLSEKPEETFLSEDFKVTVGEQLTPEKLDAIKNTENWDKKAVRLITADECVTLDFVPHRLNIVINNQNKVRRFHYG